MFKIVITCLSTICLPVPTIQHNNFDTFEECDAVLLKIVTTWKPLQGAYNLKCIETDRT